MTDIGFDSTDYIIRGSPTDFTQEAITMSHRIGNTYTKELDKVVTHLKEHSSSAFVFVNTRRLLNNSATALEGKLKNIGISADVMHIHGKQGKSEKFALILDAQQYRGKFKWTLARESKLVTSPFNYEKESGWCGINLISERNRKYKVLV